MTEFECGLDTKDINALGILQLAHIGDAVYELLVRTWLCTDSPKKVDSVHRQCIKMVNAGSQSKAVDIISESLTAEETEIYKRGKNAKVNSVPKNAVISDYHKATGFEALFGYLYLKGEKERLYELFNMIVSGKED